MPTKKRIAWSTRCRRAWRIDSPRCWECRAPARTAIRFPAWRGRHASSHSRWRRPRKAASSSSSASRRKPKPTKSFSSISGATRSGPVAASRSWKWRRGPARSRPAAMVRRSRSGCPPRRRFGFTDRPTREGEARMKLFFWGLVAVAAAYVAYAVMMSAWQYFQVSGVVDDVMQPRTLAELGSAGAMKSRILKDTAESGVPLQERDVSVTVDNRTYTVNIVWSFPVIIYHGEPLLSIPLSLKRTTHTAGAFYLPAGRAFASAIIRSTRERSSPAGTSCTKRSHERIALAVSFF